MAAHESDPLLVDLSSVARTPPVAHQSKRERTGTVLGSTFNLINSVLGAGMLSVPFAVRSAGIVPAVVLLVVCAVMADVSLRLLCLSQYYGRGETFESLADKVLGPRWRITALIGKVVLSFGACVGYLVALGDLLPGLIQDWGIGSDRAVALTVATLGPILGLALLRDLSALWFTSAIAVVSILYLTVVVIAQAVDVPPEVPADVTVELFDLKVDTLRSIGIFFYSFGCHMSSAALYVEMRDPRPANYFPVARYTVASTFVLYVTVGLAGYLTWGTETDANLFLNYADSNTLMTIGRWAMAVTLATTYPLVSYVCRQVVHDLLYPEAPEMPTRLLVIETVCVVGSTLLLAVIIPDISTVFGVVGASAGVLLYFVLPCKYYLALLPSLPDLDARQQRRARWGVTFLLLVSGTTGVVATVAIILEEVGVL